MIKIENEIKRTIGNVRTTLAVEGLKMSRSSITYGRKYLRGQISSEEAIELITKGILTKKGKKKG